MSDAVCLVDGLRDVVDHLPVEACLVEYGAEEVASANLAAFDDERVDLESVEFGRFRDGVDFASEQKIVLYVAVAA